MKPVYKSLLIAAALGAAGFGALAQMGPKGDHLEMRHMGSMHHGDTTKMAERVNSHLSGLKNKLHITASQEGAWGTFTAAMQSPAKMNALRPDRAELDKLTTPERIDKMKQLRLQHHETMLTHMNQRDEAVKALYGALNADQKKVLDAEHARMEKGSGRHERMKS
jgi:periplasmic protein CpxP/Spy